MRKKDLLKEFISKIIDASDDLGLDLNLKVNNLITKADIGEELLDSMKKDPEGREILEKMRKNLEKK